MELSDLPNWVNSKLANKYKEFLATEKESDLKILDSVISSTDPDVEKAWHDSAKLTSDPDDGQVWLAVAILHSIPKDESRQKSEDPPR